MGEWLNDEKHGNGYYTYKNGDFYSGHFTNGKKQGKGTYTFNDGQEYVGEFEDDRMVEEDKEGYRKEFGVKITKAN